MRFTEAFEIAVGDVNRLNFREELRANFGVARRRSAAHLPCGRNAPLVRADKASGYRDHDYPRADPQTP
jgi:hypothetical protein